VDAGRKVRWLYQQYSNTDVHNDRLQGSLGLTRRLGRSLQAALVAARTRSTGTLDTDTFTENRVSLIVSLLSPELSSRMFDPVTEFRYYDRPTRAPLSQPNSRSIPGTP